MGKFRYEVMASPGERLQGGIEAESAIDAVAELCRRGYHILNLEEAGPERRSLRRALRLKEVAFIARQLARLLRSGVSLIRAFKIVEEQARVPAVARVLADLRARVQEGDSFSEALGSHARSFGAWQVSLVRAGEAGGMLDQTLARIADLLEREIALRGRMRAAFAYPGLMMAVGCATVFFLLAFVFPKVTVLFDEARESLPIPTLLLMRISDFVAGYWWAVLAGVFLAGALLHAAIRTGRGGEFAGRLVLKTPTIGSLVLRAESGRFARVLGTLLGNGVPMLQALEITRSTLSNAVLRQSVASMIRRVRQGEALSRCIETERRFPGLMASIAAVGEESGSLDQALLDLSREYDMEVERSAETLVSLLEPALIVAVGGVVGFIVTALLLPIFELNEVIQ